MNSRGTDLQFVSGGENARRFRILSKAPHFIEVERNESFRFVPYATLKSKCNVQRRIFGIFRRPITRRSLASYMPTFRCSIGFASDAAGFLGLVRSKNPELQFNRTDVDNVTIRERCGRFDHGATE
jgi:hypothetical protein